jgi:hypothetical protein
MRVAAALIVFATADRSTSLCMRRYFGEFIGLGKRESHQHLDATGIKRNRPRAIANGAGE